MDRVWKAKWVMDRDFQGLIPVNVFHKELVKTVAEEHIPQLKNHHMLVRKKFVIHEIGQKAFLDISADDYYKLYINGQYIGQGPAPSYYFQYRYNRYDVGKYLQVGENIISVHVYYQGLINRVWNSGDYRQGLIAELSIENEIALFTDETWKYTRALQFTGSEIMGYQTQFREDIDSRLEEKNWRELDYDDDRWQNVFVNLCDDHKLVLQETPPLAVYEKKPKMVETIGAGHYWIDFGQEITGQFQVEAFGEAGQSVTILCGEELINDTEKRVRYHMRCNCNYEDTWILSGIKDVLEFYDYKAFRYVEVIGPEGVLVPESICAVVRHYPMQEDKSKFDSSNALLNGIWNMCKNGVKYGAQEVFVDCPSREKGQYLGDATVAGHSHIYLAGDLRLFKKCIRDFALSTYICPGIMAVAPGSHMQEIADFSLQWPYQLLQYFMHSKDIAFLKEMYPIAEGVIAYFQKYQREDGLLEKVEEKWNLVDWPEGLRDQYDFSLTNPIGEGCHNVINAFFCGAVKSLQEIQKILCIPYKDEFAQLKESYINAFYDREQQRFRDTTTSHHTALHSNMLPLFWGLVPEEAQANIVQWIKDKKLSCGVYSTYFLLKGLANAGAYDVVYGLLTSCEEQSWANMLKEGATTCFEAWGKDQKWNTSLCHPWASAPISVMIEDIIGIRPSKPGWEEVSFTPHIPRSLDYLYIAFDTIKGKISMEYKDGVAQIVVPHGCKLVLE